MKVAHIFVSGLVQGVGYRKFVKKRAQALNLPGWVQNLPDGRVELVACGEKKTIDKLVKKLWEGSFVSDVQNIVVSWVEDKETYSSFEIRR